jgi:hypothetical protein
LTGSIDQPSEIMSGRLPLLEERFQLTGVATVLLPSFHNLLEDTPGHHICTMLLDPHKLGVHKILKHVPLNALFLDRPYQMAVQKAVNIADLRAIASKRAHKMI